MTIVWSPRAIEHLTHLRAYIARDNPKAANRIAGTLLEAVERLMPYRLRGDRLEVIAVFHARQKWPKHL